MCEQKTQCYKIIIGQSADFVGALVQILSGNAPNKTLEHAVQSITTTE